ncbi:helix-turn-helix domain-containing protein [Vagococcus fluvialis]|uniref:helix-turn-helix domain-containing protein n=1 Tax=Vagococcus fluvialis TaxID=2738 RepID=UPI001A8DAED5|nr:helix-turn-helix domain-containing protein [Vagococcus fluvialis]
MFKIINLLSKQDKRYLLILESLFIKESTTIKDLMTVTNSSRKTIREDLQVINEFIDPMIIKTSHEGCYLDYPLNIGIDFIYSCILQNSIEYSFLEMIFFEKRGSIEAYAEDLYLSPSTIRRMITRINKQTKKYGFKISTAKLQLVGNEAHIYNTMIHYFKEKYIHQNYPFSKIQKKALNILINYALKKHSEFNTMSDIELLELIALVSLVRIQNNHQITISIDTEIDDFLAEILEDKMLKTLFKSVFRIELSKKNIIHLFYPFIKGEFAFTYEDVLKVTKKNDRIKQHINDTNQYIDNIADILSIPISNKEQIIIEVFNLIILNAGKDYLLFNKKMFFLANFSKESPYITNVLYKEIEKNFIYLDDITDNDKDQFIYNLVIHWKELSDKVYSFNPIYRVGIYMNWDIEHNSFINGVLSQQFLGRLTFEPILANNYEEAKVIFQNYDFILTNISNLEAANITFIVCNEYPSVDDLYNISKMYSKLLAQ